jgi:AcrR family transcriptional regulator
MPGRKASELARREQILRAALGVAIRQRLAGFRIRDVAREAGISTGLVLFHFKTKDALIAALLEWLLESTRVLRPETRARSSAPARASLCTLIRAEAQRLSTNRRRSELFFDFWVAGTRTARLRAQMRRALTDYRQEFRSLAVEMLAASRSPHSGATADGIAAAAVSFVHGCAIQAVIDPSGFDLRATLGVLDALAAQVHAASESELSGEGSRLRKSAGRTRLRRQPRISGR